MRRVQRGFHEELTASTFCSCLPQWGSKLFPAKLRHPHLAGQGTLSYNCCFASKSIPTRVPAAPGAVKPGRAWPHGDSILGAELSQRKAHARKAHDSSHSCSLLSLTEHNPAQLPACATPGRAHIQQDKPGVKWVSAAPAQPEETE